MNELQLERQDREELQTQVGGWGAGQARALSLFCCLLSIPRPLPRLLAGTGAPASLLLC
jgi:hypothetical protein